MKKVSAAFAFAVNSTLFAGAAGFLGYEIAMSSTQICLQEKYRAIGLESENARKQLDAILFAQRENENRILKNLETAKLGDIKIVLEAVRAIREDHRREREPAENALRVASSKFHTVPEVCAPLVSGHPARMPG